ncbi:MAG: hypothetical protein AMXMBFR84_41710 [Candidatus Hydrogenedentota bacterium]
MLRLENSMYHCRKRIAFLLMITVLGCGKSTPPDGSDPIIGSVGTVEVTARLTDIQGEFPPNDLYDYAYVMKYDVVKTHRGNVSGSILVGHYNPLKPRSEAADQRADDVGGNVTAFHVGDVHRLALEVPIDEYCMAGIINKYADQEESPIYWAVWTNEVVQ